MYNSDFTKALCCIKISLHIQGIDSNTLFQLDAVFVLLSSGVATKHSAMHV